MKSAKECVKTHLPNLGALKMDDAEAFLEDYGIETHQRGECRGGVFGV